MPGGQVTRDEALRLASIGQAVFTPHPVSALATTSICIPVAGAWGAPPDQPKYNLSGRGGRREDSEYTYMQAARWHKARARWRGACG